MDILKSLIILKGEDRTESIESYKINKGLIDIKFKNISKIYTYSRANCIMKFNPESIDVQRYQIIPHGGEFLNVTKLLRFEEYFRIFFENNTNKVLHKNDVRFRENALNDCKTNTHFEYFKDIANIVSIRTEEGEKLLVKEYQKINFLDEKTALARYLNPTKYLPKESNSIGKIIYPFGSNFSQMQAVKSALSNQITIIQGPPGTGKTQTILNIISNLIINEKTVAVVSNNNSATDNVYEKLQSRGLDFLCARLGKKENRDKFIIEQKEYYPKITETKDVYEKTKRVIALNEEIFKLHKIKNELCQAESMIEALLLEKKYYYSYENLEIVKSSNNIKSKVLLKIKNEIEYKYGNKKKISFFDKFKYSVLWNVKNIKFYDKSNIDIIEYFDYWYYQLKENELKHRIEYLKNSLKSYSYEGKSKKLSELSNDLINNYIYHKYNFNKQRKIFEPSDFFHNGKVINKEYPIILSTTHSIKNCFGEGYIFDYVIIDEASQVDLITGILAMSCAKNIIIVGDKMQLPNVITNDNKDKILELAQSIKIGSAYDYTTNSLLSSVEKVFKDIDNILLKEHYRCHPKIINFCNRKFYDNKLIPLTVDNNEEDVIKVLKTVAGNHSREHFNQRQIDEVIKEVLPELKEKTNDIGIISPYRQQTNMLKSYDNLDGIPVDTVHKFQGREKEAIIITTVDNEITEFVNNPNLINVAISRAKKYLRVIVADKIEETDNNIKDLIDYVKYNNFEILSGNTKSIFDFLYKENNKVRIEYLKGKKIISEYDSENLVYNLIIEILKENNYTNLDLLTHVRLKDIICKTEELEIREKQYLLNNLTHVDIVIYNKFSKMIVLAIEVDGYKFHKTGTKQSERDILKNNILIKSGVEYLRLSTTGSEERELINLKLRKVLNLL